MFEAIRSETDTDLVELHVRWLAKTANAFDMPIVLTPTLATATPVLTEAKHPATRETRRRKVPDTEHGSRRVAVVTGGAGAIGGAIAARLAPDHTVVVLDRTGDVIVDLGDPDDVRRSADLVLDRYGRCDVFVHAAAMVAFGPFGQFELDVWRRVQAVNVESALLLTQAFAPGMRDRGFGRVIFIVSNTFWRPPGAHMLAYVASKGALIGMVRTLAVGLGSDGVAVTAVAPGLTRTPATDVVPAAEFADVEAHQALPRPLTPEDTAAVVAMLAGDDAAALTGQTLTVDGGLVLR
jgi:NAD(P)-dependent dehydrogenase (short-subunit alcohol dehydrogenase family)